MVGMARDHGNLLAKCGAAESPRPRATFGATESTYSFPWRSEPYFAANSEWLFRSHASIWATIWVISLSASSAS